MVRDFHVMIRLSAEEHTALFAAARREDIPASQLARRALKQELERLGAEQKKGKYRVQR